MNEFDIPIYDFKIKIDRRCYKGGGGGMNVPPSAKLTKEGKEQQDLLYSDVIRAYAGGGMLPGRLAFQNLTEQQGALKGAYSQARTELSENIGRYVQPGDSNVSGYIDRSLGASEAREGQGLLTADMLRKYNDKSGAIAMGQQLTGGERKYSMDYYGAWQNANNQMMANEAQYGSFGSNIASGLGWSGGYLLNRSAAERYAQTPV